MVSGATYDRETALLRQQVCTLADQVARVTAEKEAWRSHALDNLKVLKAINAKLEIRYQVAKVMASDDEDSLSVEDADRVEGARIRAMREGVLS